MNGRALIHVKRRPDERFDCFAHGARRLGMEVRTAWFDPSPGDLLVTWNRYGTGARLAEAFAAAGAAVVVVENAYIEPADGGTAYAIALDHHLGAGTVLPPRPEEVDRLGVRPARWRADSGAGGGGEVVILGSRGIGPDGVAEPIRWAERRALLAVRNLMPGVRVRVRSHPGRDKAAVRPLMEDLARASAVVTWASRAGVTAMLAGIPCYRGLQSWIAADAAPSLAQAIDLRMPLGVPARDGRADMLAAICGAQAMAADIRSGERLRDLLDFRRALQDMTAAMSDLAEQVRRDAPALAAAFGGAA